MKLPVITLLVLGLNLFTTVAQDKQTSENPFDKLGYDPLVATSSRGDYEEFHDKENLVEIGSVLFNTKINKVVKILEDGETAIDLSNATAAMSIDPLCEKYYWISPYVYCANNPIINIDPDGRDWFTNRENGNVTFIRGVDDLSKLDKDQIEKYGLGDITKYDNMGADNMFGDDVRWGIYGEEGGSFNVLDKESQSFGNLSANFMDLQGYSKKISKEKVERTEHIKYISEPGAGATSSTSKLNKRNLGQGSGDNFPKETISEYTQIEYSYIPKGLTEVNIKTQYELGLTAKISNHLGGRYETSKYTKTYTYSAPRPQSLINKVVQKILNTTF